MNEIECEVPIETVKSIDELACKLSPHEAADPVGLSTRIKNRIARNVGPHITCSIGIAQNRLLAKVACKMDKPNGVTIWKPSDMPGPLLNLPIDEMPGIGTNMERRLVRAGITDMSKLLSTQPKQLRKLWGNVTGERMWYALHGYAIAAQPTSRGMYGHGRVLSPEWRSPRKAEACTRMLLIRVVRRMVRDGWAASKLHVWLDLRLGKRSGGWFGAQDLPAITDYKAAQDGLKAVWQRAHAELPDKVQVIRAGVTLMDLTPQAERQMDLLLDDDAARRRWETLTTIMDGLNRKYGKRVLDLGLHDQPPGGWAGSKIAYTRIPSAEDFY